MSAGDTTITFIGNLVDDPDLRFTTTGAAVVNFRVASTSRSYDRQAGEWRDTGTVFLTCVAWRQMAENIAETLTRGTRVIVYGRVRQETYETRSGEKRTVDKIDVDEVAPSLRNATAKVNKIARTAPSGTTTRPADDDPWLSPATSPEEPPF